MIKVCVCVRARACMHMCLRFVISTMVQLGFAVKHSGWGRGENRGNMAGMQVMIGEVVS